MRYNSYLLEKIPRAEVPAAFLAQVLKLHSAETRITYMRGRVSQVLWVIVHDGKLNMRKTIREAEDYETAALQTAGGVQ